MKIRIELTEHDVRRLVAEEIRDKTGHVITADKIQVEVKSKQNYKSEWESCEFRAVYEAIGGV